MSRPNRISIYIPNSVKVTFSALHYPGYRLWMLGQLFGFFGMWVQITAQGYLIFELTNSTAFLGYVSFISGLPSYFLSIYGGVVADRIPRRTLLIVTQFVMMVIALILSGLIFSNSIQPWHIIVIAFASGIANSFDLPTRQVFVSELVEKDDLVNAIALNSTMFNSATVIGPAVGGIIYALTGPGYCFFINGLSYIAVILILVFIRPAIPIQPRPKTTILMDLKEGLVYTKNSEVVRTMILSGAFFVFFGYSFVTLTPAWAVDILGGDVKTNGLLLSSRGFGALIGALMLAFLSHGNIRGKLWTAGSFVLPVALFIFSFIRWLPLSLFIMTLFGWGLFALFNVTNTLIQTTVPDHLRGRVMGIYTLIFQGTLPLGSLVIATLAEKINAPAVVLACALIIFCLSAYMYFKKSYIRSLG